LTVASSILLFDMRIAIFLRDRPLVGVLVALTLVSGFAGELRAQAWSVEVRAGAVASTALVEDGIATRQQLQALGIPGAEVEALTLRAAPAPVIGAAVTATLRPQLTLEMSGGYTATELVAVSGGSERRLQNMGIGHGVVALRQQLSGNYDVSAGLGLVRYAGDGTGIFLQGPERTSVVEVGAGGVWRVGHMLLSLRSIGQMHRFGTTALRAEGGLDGRVYRFGLLGGVGLGVGGGSR
jgi:hypothetical protein